MKTINNPLAPGLKEQYTPVKQFGKWVVLVKNDNPYSLCVCGIDWVDWPIIYHHNLNVAYDNPYRVPETVKKWIRTVYVNRLVKKLLESIDK